MLPILRLLRAAAGSDRDLLDRYVRNRDDEAFEAIVHRYGIGVWSACVRLAGRDAEDAFQAVFLTLSRKAGTVTGSLPAWLHSVARRVASTLRREARRRNAIETKAARPDQADCADPSLSEALALLDEELSRLPERYRSVLIVCCLEGRSRDEAAAQLGWSEGQVKGRLERARDMLHTRLARRGVELGGLLLVAAAAGPVPVRADSPSPAASTLSQGVIRAMIIRKIRLTAAGLVACVGVALAGGVALRAQPGDSPSVPLNAVADAPKDRSKATPQDQIDEAKKEIDSLRKRIETLEKQFAPPAAERVKIVVTSPRLKDVVLTQQYVAKISGQRYLEVRNRLTGVISEVFVKEGQSVKKGEVLFKLVPTLQQAKLDAEKAEMQIAKLEYDNSKKLFDSKVISPQELKLQEAKLAKADAKVKLAEFELDLTIVRAPFDGLTGRILQQAGSTVKDGDALTTLSDNGALWVYFKVPEARYLEYMADPKQMKDGFRIELLLANGRTYPHEGKFAAIEGQFANDGESIIFRADFPNPDRLLRHGQTGTVLIRQTMKSAIVIPQRSAFEIGDKLYVYVLGPDGTARRRGIEIQSEQEDFFVVGKGLGVKDKIVLEGLRQLRDGDKPEYEFRETLDVAGK